MSSSSSASANAGGGTGTSGGSGAGTSGGSSAGGGRKKRNKRPSPSSRVTLANMPDTDGPQKIDVSTVTVGMRGCTVESWVVTKTDAGYIHVKTDGGTIMVARDVFGYDTYASPDQFTQTVRCSKTALVQVLHKVGDRLFFVRFVKADGKTERSMYAKMKGKVDTIFGRSTVCEQLVEGPKVTYQERQVDHRTLLEVRFKGIRYMA
jgi:hypothetical protein